MPDPQAPSLEQLIGMQIRQLGPMSIRSYMGLALGHKRHGYYSSGDPLGTKGDFVTAPEISQMFGELVGFFLVNTWQQLGEPKSFTLFELGPGRGTLMQDALRVASRAEGFIDGMHLQLFETNETLTALQLERLGDHHPYWAPDIGSVPEDDPLLVVANEFFDAMPINQYVRAADGWHERQVGLSEFGDLKFGLSPVAVPPESLPAELRNAAIGEVFEDSLHNSFIIKQLGRRIAAQRGALLAIDYGYAQTQPGETLQAVHKHEFVDPLYDPGEVDLSAHVDFGALTRAAIEQGLTVAPLTAQRDFLGRLGIVERASQLAKANPGQIDTIAAALRRLTDPDQMGTLFKVFCATSSGLEPIGFQ